MPCRNRAALFIGAAGRLWARETGHRHLWRWSAGFWRERGLPRPLRDQRRLSGGGGCCHLVSEVSAAQPPSRCAGAQRERTGLGGWLVLFALPGGQLVCVKQRQPQAHSKGRMTCSLVFFGVCLSFVCAGAVLSSHIMCVYSRKQK